MDCYLPLHRKAHELLVETDKINQIRLKTLVLVHPGSLFGSAEFSVGKMASIVRDKVQAQLKSHVGRLIVIDGHLSDEIDSEFGKAIYDSLENAVKFAQYFGQSDSISALRLWGCDARTDPYASWYFWGDNSLPNVFHDIEDTADFLCQNLHTHEIEVTGAWATEHGRWGCVNAVAEMLRDGMPEARVTISDTALFEEYGWESVPVHPHFNAVADLAEAGS